MTDHLPAPAGVGAVADHFEAEQETFTKARYLALHGLPEGFLDSIKGSAAGEAFLFVQDTRERFTLTSQHVDMFAGMRGALKASSLFDLAGAVNFPRFGSAIETLGIDRFSSAVEATNEVQDPRLSPTFHDEFKSVAVSLSEQASAFVRAKDLASVSTHDFDLAGKLESMLARSLLA